MKAIGTYPEGVLERLQEIETNILLVIDEVCEELGIPYVLDSGTCLGAVRHGGPIPWDDDADIGMLYEDYVRFCNEADPLLKKRGCSLHMVGNTENYPCTWAKVYKDGTLFLGDAMMQSGNQQGIFVDVFYYVDLDQREKVAKKQIQTAVWAQRLLYLYYIKRPDLHEDGISGALKLFASSLAHGVVSKVLSPLKIMGMLDKISVAEQPGDRVFKPAYALTGTYPRAAFLPVQRVDYAGHSLPIPGDYHTILTTMFGEYMTPPPEGKRGKSETYILDFGDGINQMTGKSYVWPE